MNKLLIFITFLVAALATTNAIHSTAKDNIMLPGTGSNTIQKTRMAATGSNDGDANAKQVMEEFYFGFLSEDVGQNGADGNAIHPFEFLKDLTDEQ